MKKTLAILATLMLAVLVLSSCRKEREMRSISFNSTIEQPDTDGTKVALVREKWAYWEIGDQIDLASDLTAMTYGDLVNSSAGTEWDVFNGVFIALLDWESKYFLGLFPRNAGNVITPAGAGNSNFTVKINLNEIQPLRSDTTFGRDVYPMVAWFGGDVATELPNLNFHSLGCLLRLQIYTTDALPHTIDYIKVTSDHQLWGQFNVVGYNTAEPYLAGEDAGADKKTLTLTANADNPTLAAMNGTTLHTFYVVMPAFGTRYSPTTHNIDIEVYDTDGKYCKRSLTAGLRRNGITFLPALNITGWADSPSAGDGNAARGISGNGTELRPFKIYTVADLNFVREAFESTDALPTNPVVINNQQVTADSYFRIMRSDIELTTSNWPGGIKNFRGHLSYAGANPTAIGITNNSAFPLFQSISSNGEVKGLRMVRANQTFASSGDWSPFCSTNNGTIKDCRISSTGGAIQNGNPSFATAGICLTNNGTIEGCGCNASFNVAGPFAGICRDNAGTVRGCFISSPGTVSGATNAGGICLNNGGNIYDSYFAMSVSGSTNWGGIAFSNTSRIEHCYGSASGHITTTGSAAGIVNNQSSDAAVVDYCYSETDISGSNIGSIVATLSGGRVINSFVDNTSTVLIVNAASHRAGGLVGTMSGGNVVNCFCHMDHIARPSGGITGGMVGYISGGYIRNSYAYQANPLVNTFYGSTTLDGTELTNHLGGDDPCYLVGATQTGVTTMTTSQLVSTMMPALNGRVAAIGSIYGLLKGWVDASGVPVLEAY